MGLTLNDIVICLTDRRHISRELLRCSEVDCRETQPWCHSTVAELAPRYKSSVVTARLSRIGPLQPILGRFVLGQTP